jgi:hypothetical protein
MKELVLKIGDFVLYFAGIVFIVIAFSGISSLWPAFK